MFKKKAWQDSNDTKLKVIINPFRGSNLTVIGAITNYRGRLFYHIADKTDSNFVVEFLKKYEKDFERMVNPVIIMDRHRAHTSNIVKEKLNSLNIK